MYQSSTSSSKQLHSLHNWLDGQWSEREPKVTKVNNNESGDKKDWLALPYKGDQETRFLKLMK